MGSFTFNRERTCPGCQGTFSAAEQLTEHDPLVVVTCPHCEAVLWRPGSDEDSDLYPYDPNADSGGI